jgi:hypothetical protein
VSPAVIDLAVERRRRDPLERAVASAPGRWRERIVIIARAMARDPAEPKRCEARWFRMLDALEWSLSHD